MLLMLDQSLARLRARQQINSARSRLRNPKRGIRKAVLRSAVDLDRIQQALPMGKRSSFERRKADFYPTPRAAVVPLIPCLRRIRSFAEPCAGDGALVRHLEAFDLRCVYAGDICTGQDALAVNSYGKGECIITNPPFSRESRPLMHRMILHFQRIAPTWLLLPHDWSTNKGSAPYLRCCSDIVAIGRVKWFQGSKHTGKDNYGWFRFDARHASGPVFHGRDQGEVTPARRREYFGGKTSINSRLKGACVHRCVAIRCGHDFSTTYPGKPADARLGRPVSVSGGAGKTYRRAPSQRYEDGRSPPPRPRPDRGCGGRVGPTKVSLDLLLPAPPFREQHEADDGQRHGGDRRTVGRPMLPLIMQQPK
jgi:hypothetical protein